MLSILYAHRTNSSSDQTRESNSTERLRCILNKGLAFILLLSILPCFANEVTVPVSTYAFNTPYHETEGSVTLVLPDTWNHSEHNGVQYLIGGKDVYGTISLAYNEMNIMNFTSQFGTPTPPSTEIAGVTVYNQVKGDSASFLRKLGEGWSLRASLTAYPAFAGKNMGVYAEAMSSILAAAVVSTPDSESISGASGTISISHDIGNFLFAPKNDVWRYEDNILTYQNGVSFKPKVIFDNKEGLSYLEHFSRNTGIEGEIWEKFSFPQVIGATQDNTTYAMAHMGWTDNGDAFVLLSGNVQANEQIKDALISFLQSRVK